MYSWQEAKAVVSTADIYFQYIQLQIMLWIFNFKATQIVFLILMPNAIFKTYTKILILKKSVKPTNVSK